MDIRLDPHPGTDFHDPYSDSNCILEQIPLNAKFTLYIASNLVRSGMSKSNCQFRYMNRGTTSEIEEDTKSFLCALIN